MLAIYYIVIVRVIVRLKGGLSISVVLPCQSIVDCFLDPIRSLWLVTISNVAWLFVFVVDQCPIRIRIKAIVCSFY